MKKQHSIRRRVQTAHLYKAKVPAGMRYRERRWSRSSECWCSATLWHNIGTETHTSGRFLTCYQNIIESFTYYARVILVWEIIILIFVLAQYETCCYRKLININLYDTPSHRSFSCTCQAFCYISLLPYWFLQLQYEFQYHSYCFRSNEKKGKKKKRKR